MNQIDIATYGVAAGETVTVEVEAIQVGEFSTFSLDGSELDPEPGVSPKAYKFNVTVGPGFSHFGMVSCNFPTSAPDSAKFQIFVSGDQGGGKFTGPDIKKNDLGHTSDLEFQCS